MDGNKGKKRKINSYQCEEESQNSLHKVTNI
jgi:hypothetical protein